MKPKKLIAALLISTSILGTIAPFSSNLVFAEGKSNIQANQESIDIVSDTALKHLLNEIVGQDKDATLTKEQLASITEITGNWGFATGTLSCLEGLQYCTSLKKLSCMFDGTVTDFSVLGGLSSHVEFGMMSNINSNVTKTTSMSANGEITLVNPYKDVDGTPLQPTTISNEGTYDEKSNSIHWTNLDKSKDYTLRVNYDKSISGLNSSTLEIYSTLEVNALASNQEKVTFIDEQLKTGIIQNLNQQNIDGNSTRKATDPVYKNELEKLESLDLTNQGIQNLSGLEYCVNVKTLNLANNEISDISLIANLKQLVNVDLSDNQLNNISVFKNSTSLETITVNNNNIANIDEGLLLTMPALRHFNATKNKLTDFTFVNDWADALYEQSIQLWGKSSADVTNQKTLEVTEKNEKNEIQLKNPIKGTTSFKLSDNGIYDKNTNTFIWKNVEKKENVSVTFTEGEQQFKYGGLILVKIENNDVYIRDSKLKAAINKQLKKSSNYNPKKEELQQIKTLSVPFNKIKDLKGLENCTNLIELDLNGNQYSDVTPIANLTQLKTLNIANNKNLNDISSLKNLKNMTNLYADYSNISDISALKNMPNLKVLHLPFNKIKDLKGLENCTNLTELDLNGNQYSDVTPIANLTQLKTLNIANNKNLNDISGLKNLKNMTNLYADYSNISDISALKNMPNLKVLHLPGNPIQNYDVIKNLDLTDFTN